MQLLCRNRVKDYDVWLRVFQTGQPGQEESGLTLVKLWRGVDHPEEAFFLFDVHDKQAAIDFMHSPESEATGVAAGVIDGDYHFIESLDS